MTILKRKKISAKAFDKAFEKGDVTGYLDPTSVKPRPMMQRISIDFPKNILDEVDSEADKIGVTRTALIKLWVAQHVHT